MMLFFPFFLNAEKGEELHHSPRPKETLWRVCAGAKHQPPALGEQGTWTVFIRHTLTSCSAPMGALRFRFGSGVSQLAAAGSRNVGNHWHPTSSYVATQAPFPMLEGKTPGLQSRERYMSWSEWSRCFAWLPQLPICLCPYHQPQPKNKHVQMLPDHNTSSGSLLEVSYHCQPADSTRPPGTVRTKALLRCCQHSGSPWAGSGRAQQAVKMKTQQEKDTHQTKSAHRENLYTSTHTDCNTKNANDRTVQKALLFFFQQWFYSRLRSQGKQKW